MLEAIVATLAVGRRYVEMAQVMLAAHTRAGNAALVVTDEPSAFPGIEALSWQPDGAHVWHAKRHAVRAALERAQTVYVMDADHVPRAPAPRLGLLPPGPHSHFRRLPLVDITLPGVGKLNEPPAAPWLAGAAAAVEVDLGRLWWWGDSLWAVSRDAGREIVFCDGWDRFAAFTVAHPPARAILGGDGVAMSFAARAAGWGRIPRADFGALQAAFKHAELGDWRNLPSL